MEKYNDDITEERGTSGSDVTVNEDPSDDVTLPGDKTKGGDTVPSEAFTIGGGTGLSRERIRLIRTTSMTLLYIIMGLASGIISPATLDLMELYHCSLEQLSLMMTAKQIGLLIGSFAGGFVFNRLRDKVDLALSGAGFLISFANASIPWCQHLWIAGIAVSLTGLSHGTINVVCSSVTMAEWRERAPAPVNMLHFAFSVGSFLAPLTVLPFLSKTIHNNTLTTDNWLHLGGYDDYSLPSFTAQPLRGQCEEPHLASNTSVSDRTHIYIPFAFHGVVGVLGGALFLVYHLVGWRSQSVSSRNTGNNTSIGQGGHPSDRITDGDIPPTNGGPTTNKNIGGDIPPTNDGPTTNKNIGGDIPPTNDGPTTNKNSGGDIPPINGGPTTNRITDGDIPPTNGGPTTNRITDGDIPPTNGGPTTNKNIGGDIPPTTGGPTTNTVTEGDIPPTNCDLPRPSGSITTARRWGSFRIMMAVGIYLAYVGIIVRAVSINTFIFYIGVNSPLKLSKSRAAMLNTANNGSMVVGRLLGTILARFVRVHLIVFGSIAVVLCLTVFLMLYAFRSELILWMLVCLVSVLTGPCYASVMAWANCYTEMDGIMVAIVDFGISSGATFALYVGAHIVHHNGPRYAFILSGAAAAMLLTVMIVLQVVCYRRGQRFISQAMPTATPVDEGEQMDDDTEPLIR